MAASYESTVAGVTDAIQGSIADGAISAATAAAVTGLLAGLTEAQAATAIQADPVTTANASSITSPLLIMTDGANVNADFGAASPVKAVILGDPNAPASNITFATNDNVTVQLGGAQGDQVMTASGNDTITFTGGSASVDAGSGADTIVIQGEGNVNITQGDGDSTIRLETQQTAATIDAGDGFDSLVTGTHRSEHHFTFQGGKFIMNSGAPITMENVNVVQFMNGNSIEDITVLASTKGEALVATLYQVALGREAIDANGGNVDGLKFWLDQFDDGNGSNADPAFLIAAFLACPEFGNKTNALNDQQFVQQLMNNIQAGTTTIDGQDAAYYAQQLESGRMDREDVVTTFVNSDEAAAALAADGYVIEGFGA